MKPTTRIDIIKAHALFIADLCDQYQIQPETVALECIQTFLSKSEKELGLFCWELENPGLSVLLQEADLHRLAFTIPVETPEEEEALDELEAKMGHITEAERSVFISRYREHSKSLEEQEAKRIDNAHPEVFNMADFAARSLGMSKGA